MSFIKWHDDWRLTVTRFIYEIEMSVLNIECDSLFDDVN